MKFRHFLAQVEAYFPNEWQGKFLNYKVLKKAVKDCPAAAGKACCQVDEDRFFALLEQEVQSVNREFEAAAAAILKERGPVARMMGALTTNNTQAEVGQALRARWCRRYARVNSLALRKIAKKHDKRCANTAGAAFVQACWTGTEMQRGAILHSPLLTELRALQQKVIVKIDGPLITPADIVGGDDPAAEQERQWHLAHGILTGGKLPELNGVQATEPDSAGQLDDKADHSHHDPEDLLELTRSTSWEEEDEICPICLDLLFEPVGLKCGHAFCQCCFQEALAQDNERKNGPGVPRSHISVTTQCPDCRQEGVCKDAIPLKQLGKLLKLKHPREYRQRSTEIRETKREALRQSQRERVPATFTWGL